MTRLLPMALLGMLAGLAGCALHPLYAGGSSGSVATTLAGVEVGPIEGKAGWLMGNALRDRLAGGDGSALSSRCPPGRPDRRTRRAPRRQRLARTSHVAARATS